LTVEVVAASAGAKAVGATVVVLVVLVWVLLVVVALVVVVLVVLVMVFVVLLVAVLVVLVVVVVVVVGVVVVLVVLVGAGRGWGVVDDCPVVETVVAVMVVVQPMPAIRQQYCFFCSGQPSRFVVQSNCRAEVTVVVMVVALVVGPPAV